MDFFYQNQVFQKISKSGENSGFHMKFFGHLKK